MFEPALGPNGPISLALERSLPIRLRLAMTSAARALAAWFLAGTDRYRVDQLSRRQGRLQRSGRCYGSLGVPADWLALAGPSSSHDAMAARRHAAARLPQQGQWSHPAIRSTTRPYETWRGVPLYALDSSRGVASSPSDDGWLTVPIFGKSFNWQLQFGTGRRSPGTPCSPSKAKSATVT